jgi:hypothetical protein
MRRESGVTARTGFFDSSDRLAGYWPFAGKLLETHAAAAVSLMLDFIGHTKKTNEGEV